MEMKQYLVMSNDGEDIFFMVYAESEDQAIAKVVKDTVDHPSPLNVKDFTHGNLMIEETKVRVLGYMDKYHAYLSSIDTTVVIAESPEVAMELYKNAVGEPDDFLRAAMEDLVMEPVGMEQIIVQ